MPINQAASDRHDILDRCLRDRSRTWTMKQMADEVSDFLIERGMKGISLSSIEKDLRYMQTASRFLAPIDKEKVGKEWVWFYTDKHYSISNSPLDREDAKKLSRILELLKPFQHLPQFGDLEEILLKLESRNITRKDKVSRPTIQFESNPLAEGIHLVRVLHKYILKRKALDIDYRPFGKPLAKYLVSPLLLKEYNNRWFLFAKNHDSGLIQNLALDRIVTLEESIYEYIDDPEFDPELYFKDVIGVSVPNTPDKPEVIRLRFTPEQGNYIKSKPLHASQKIVTDNKRGLTIELLLIPNYELKKLIWSFGDTVKMIL